MDPLADHNQGMILKTCLFYTVNVTEDIRDTIDMTSGHLLQRNSSGLTVKILLLAREAGCAQTAEHDCWKWRSVSHWPSQFS